MGISRDSRHKRSATGAKRAYYRKKRYDERRQLDGQFEYGLIVTERSRRAASQPTHVLELSEFILSAPEEEIKNIVLCVLILATSPGARRV